MWSLSRRTLTGAATAALLVVAVGACDDNDDPPVGPDPIEESEVVGDYEPTLFDLTVDGITVDLLEEGAELTLTLAADGSTTGQLFIPEGGEEEGEDLDVALDGTWTFDEDAATVTLTTDETDVFPDAVTLEAVRADGGIRLDGEETIDEGTVEIQLTQQ